MCSLSNRVCKDVATQRIHVQRNSKVQQYQGEPDDGHSQGSIHIRRVEQGEN